MSPAHSRILPVAASALLAAAVAAAAAAAAAAALVYWRCTAGSWKRNPGGSGPEGQGGRGSGAHAEGQKGGERAQVEEGGVLESPERLPSADSTRRASVSGITHLLTADSVTLISSPKLTDSADSEAVSLAPGPTGSGGVASVEAERGQSGRGRSKPQDAFRVRLTDNSRAPFVHLPPAGKRGGGMGDGALVVGAPEKQTHPYGEDIRRLLACPPPPPQHLLRGPTASWRTKGTPEEDAQGGGTDRVKGSQIVAAPTVPAGEGTIEAGERATGWDTGGGMQWATGGDIEGVTSGGSAALGAPVWVDTEEGLQRLAARLEGEEEFAVDTEQHSLHSFLGFTALLQVSTRDGCDYIVDAIAVHDAMACLRPAFADLGILKVFHGADSDVLWLQRDFHIYTVNLFDTARACTVLQKPQRALAFLLHHYCGARTDKRLQTADWRTRPLPQPMLEYAQKDTHYLLHIADALRRELLSINPSVNPSVLPSGVANQGYTPDAPQQQGQGVHGKGGNIKGSNSGSNMNGRGSGPLLVAHAENRGPVPGVPGVQQGTPSQEGEEGRLGGASEAYRECLRRSNALCLQLYEKDLGDPRAAAPGLLKVLRTHRVYPQPHPHKALSQGYTATDGPDRACNGSGSGSACRAASGSGSGSDGGVESRGGGSVAASQVLGMHRGGAGRAGARETIEALLVWRDAAARAEDESPRYVLSDAALLSLAVNAPATPERLLACVQAAEASAQKRTTAKPISTANFSSTNERLLACVQAAEASAEKRSAPKPSSINRYSSALKPSSTVDSSSTALGSSTAEPSNHVSTSLQGLNASLCTEGTKVAPQDSGGGASWVVQWYAHKLCSLLSNSAPPHHTLPPAPERSCSNPECTAGNATPQGPGGCSCKHSAVVHPQGTSGAPQQEEQGRGSTSAAREDEVSTFWVPLLDTEEAVSRNSEFSNSGNSSHEPGQGKSGRAGRGWLRHRDPEQARKNFIRKFSCRGPVYENCRIYSGDGRLLCYCDKRKIQWYLNRGLAKYIPPPPLLDGTPQEERTKEESSQEESTHGETTQEEGTHEKRTQHEATEEESTQGGEGASAVPDGAPAGGPYEPLCIRLLFAPKGTPLDDDNDFYVQSKRNQCVACGESSHYLRYRLVPSCYRQCFPEHLKSHRSHDIVLLCVDCHEVAHKAAERHKHTVAAREGVPLKAGAVVVPPAQGDAEGVDSDNQGEVSDSQRVDCDSERVGSDRLRECSRAEASSGNPVGVPPDSRAGEGRSAAGHTIGAAEAQRAAVAVAKHGHTMPEARRRELMRTLRLFLSRPTLTPQEVGALLLRDRGRASRAHRRGTRVGGPRHQAQGPGQEVGDKQQGVGLGQERGTAGSQEGGVYPGSAPGAPLPPVLGSHQVQAAGVPGASGESLNQANQQGWGERAHGSPLEGSEGSGSATTSGSASAGACASGSAGGADGGAGVPGVPGDLSLRLVRGHQEHGKRVVEQLLTQGGEGAIKLFITEWREVFVDAVRPQFLPSGWNVHHSGAREFGDYSVYNPLRLPPQCPAPGFAGEDTP